MKRGDNEFSEIEKQAAEMVEKYGKLIHDKVCWECSGMVLGGQRIYVPYGGKFPRLKPRANMKGKWESDSEEYLIMKKFLDSHPGYRSRNAEFVRDWYGI